MTGLKSFVNFFMAQKAVIGYCLVALITIGGEHIFSVVSFDCPCSEGNFEYGMTFLLAPAAVLLILCLFFSTRLWWVYTESCSRGRMQCKCQKEDCKIVVRAFVVPVIWLCASLLNGTFYECAASGLKGYCVNDTQACFQELMKLPCAESNSGAKEQLLKFKAHAQMIAWFLCVGALFAGLFVFCCINYFSKETYALHMYKKHYARKLKERVDAFAQDYASQLAEQQIQKVLNDKIPDPLSVPINWVDIPSYNSLLEMNKKERKNEHEKEGQDNDAYEEESIELKDVMSDL